MCFQMSNSEVSLFLYYVIYPLMSPLTLVTCWSGPLDNAPWTGLLLNLVRDGRTETGVSQAHSNASCLPPPPSHQSLFEPQLCSLLAFLPREGDMNSGLIYLFCEVLGTTLCHAKSATWVVGGDGPRRDPCSTLCLHKCPPFPRNTHSWHFPGSSVV